mgnify:CR=1 FL=1
MDKKLRVGLVGAGRMAGFHIDVLSTFEDVELVSLVTTSNGTERRASICDEYNIPSNYSSVDEMIDNENIDAVFIQPSVQHVFGVAKKCLEASLHTFIEKPPGLSSEETKELLDISKRKGVVEMVGLQRRFYSHILQAKSIIDEHGDLFSLVVEAPERFTQIKNKNKFTEEVLQKWMFGNGIHMLDMFLFLGGKVNKVTSVNRTWKEDIHPDSFHALVEFDGGTVGQYISNWSSPGGWSVKMYGDGVKVDISPMEEGTVTFSDGTIEELRVEDKDVDFKPGIYNQNRMFVDACLDKGKVSYPAATLKDSLIVMELIEDIL